jgi:tetratricopeptide (TPR) repeat protein
VPSSADAHHWIAICWSRLGDVERGLAEVEAALGLDPRHAEAHALRGGLRASRGRIEEALVDLRAAVDAAPDNAPFRVGLSRILLTAGRLDDADAELRRAARQKPFLIVVPHSRQTSSRLVECSRTHTNDRFR